jgi:hypothetical protein
LVDVDLRIGGDALHQGRARVGALSHIGDGAGNGRIGGRSANGEKRRRRCKHESFHGLTFVYFSAAEGPENMGDFWPLVSTL